MGTPAAPTNVTANFRFGVVVVVWDRVYDTPTTSIGAYVVTRTISGGSPIQIATVQVADGGQLLNYVYNDPTVVNGATYTYSVAAYSTDATPVLGSDSTGAVVAIPGAPTDPGAVTVPIGVVRWRFTDVYNSGPAPYTYTFDINPNTGGSPAGEKTITTSYSLGPNNQTVLQEGHFTVPDLTFSGVILSRHHYETLEFWFSKRVLLRLDDDLGRIFTGVFAKFTPKRERRASNPWYHTYDADFLVMSYLSASGQRIYGRAINVTPPTSA